MFDNYERKLHKCIAKFIKRANKDYPDWSESRDNGEWEIDLNEFDDMCHVIFDIFGIARDNECSRIVAMLLDYPEWYELLCKKVLSTDYINAKWQFAESLKDCNGKDEIRELIFDFLQVDNEYTQRLALQSSDKAEEYAIDFWWRDKYKDDAYASEYQKIVVLHVLHIIHSAELEKYLDLADKSEYRYLKENAEEIRKIME